MREVWLTFLVLSCGAPTAQSAAAGDAGSTAGAAGVGGAVPVAVAPSGAAGLAGSSEPPALDAFRIRVQAVGLRVGVDWDPLGGSPDPYVCVETDQSFGCSAACSNVDSCELDWLVQDEQGVDVVLRPPASLLIAAYDDDVDSSDFAGMTRVVVESFDAEQGEFLALGPFEDVAFVHLELLET
jgi:hypothetical protein